MSIKLNDPIELYLEEVEIDSNLPSIQFDLQIKIQQFFSLLEFSGRIWITCDDWDVFIKNLCSSEEISILKDMNNYFLLKIVKQKDHIEFTWSFSRESIIKSMIAANYKMNISEEIFFNIKEQFVNYPKWW